MAEHARFEILVFDAKKSIQEISPQETAAALKRGDTLLIDVRDADEWKEGHIPGAKNFSRGTVELEIEEAAPDANHHSLRRRWSLRSGRRRFAANGLQKREINGRWIQSLEGGCLIC